jgi:ATP adenylyltransferase
MDHLWSPWRLEYVVGAKPKSGCVFCTAARPPIADSANPEINPQSAVRDLHCDPLVLHQGSHCYVILNLYPYNNGHLMVVPYKHTDTLTGLDPAEVHELADLTRVSEAALREAYRLEGINMGINLGKVAGAGIIDHIHVHLVPRWLGDTNFMPVIGQTRVLPEELGATSLRLRPIFERLAKSMPI